MPIGNGGIIGVRNAPLITGASGVWTLDEVFNAVADDEWPRMYLSAHGGANEDQADLSSYSFPSTSYGGAANPSRIVVCSVVVFSVGVTVTGVTIGGVTATVLGPAEGDAARTYFAYANVPTGTSGTVAVAFSGTAPNCYIGVWSCYPLSPTPASSSFPAGGSASSRSVTLDIPKRGTAFVTAGRTGGGSISNTTVQPVGPSTGAVHGYRQAGVEAESSVVFTHASTRTIAGIVWQ